jgi:hypothetical protein
MIILNILLPWAELLQYHIDDGIATKEDIQDFMREETGRLGNGYHGITYWVIEA